LRAAAALSRFEPKKEEPQIKEEHLVTDSESDIDDDVHIKNESDAIDVNGTPLLDPKGQGMIKVCGGEDDNDADTKRELSDLRDFGSANSRSFSKPRNTTKGPRTRPAFDERKEPRNGAIPAPVNDGGDANACAVCSVLNDPEALTCHVCSHVLRPEFVSGSWRCGSSTCIDTEYVNSGDAGICGICGGQP
jgi:hypothetical protein